MDVSTALVEREDERVVVMHEGLLGYDWKWSYGLPSRPAFLYATATMFAPRDETIYDLRIAVVPGSDSGDAQARLVVKGGGWKSNPPPSDDNVETLGDVPATGGL